MWATTAVTQDHTVVASLAIVGTCGCGHEGGVSESLPWLLPSVPFVFVIQVNTSHTGGAIPAPVLVEGSFQVLAGAPLQHCTVRHCPRVQGRRGGVLSAEGGSDPHCGPLGCKPRPVARRDSPLPRDVSLADRSCNDGDRSVFLQQSHLLPFSMD